MCVDPHLDGPGGSQSREMIVLLSFLNSMVFQSIIAQFGLCQKLHHNTTLWLPESNHPHCLYNTEVQNIKYGSQNSEKIGILKRLYLD